MMFSFHLDVACSEVFTTYDCFSELSVFIFLVDVYHTGGWWHLTWGGQAGDRD
jgi:hypothetical protein